MARYKLEDNTVVDTELATIHWLEAKDRQNISVNTGSEWNTETLYKSKKGRYYIERCSAWQGSKNYAVLISQKEATAWLLFNDKKLPPDLVKVSDSIIE